MNYHLDTNVVIALLRRHPAGARSRFREAIEAGDPIAVSSVVLFELWYGIAKSQRRGANTELLQVFMSGSVQILPFAEADASAAGDIRATLEAKGTPIGSYDLLIAAQALRTRATLVTANAREFSRVDGLSLQDWSAAA